MNERDNILARIHEALRVPAPRPGSSHDGSSRPGAAPTNFRSFLPPGASTLEARLALFTAKATELRAAFHILSNQQELPAALQRLRDSDKWTRIGTHSGELTNLASKSLALPVCLTDSSYDVHELEACSAGISECDALIAQTGSVLVTARSAGGRALSVLPPHHVVLARREQIVGDLTDAFALLKQKYGDAYPSFISFITGPSRTGDIERILVLGAHGPKKLTIFCV